MEDTLTNRIESTAEHILYMYKQNAENHGYEYDEMERRWFVRNQSTFLMLNNFLNTFYYLIDLDYELFNSFKNYGNIGQVYTLLAKANQNVDDATIQKITNYGYLFLTKSIEITPTNYDLYFNRLKIMLIGNRGFVNTVINAYRSIKNDIIDEYVAEDIIVNMRYADYRSLPTQIRVELESNLKLNEFGLMNDFPEAVAQGVSNLGRTSHDIINEYLLGNL